jgi:hypothetical protein
LKRTFLLLGASKSPAADETAGWTRRPSPEKKHEQTTTKALLLLLAIIVAHTAAGPL